MTLREKFRNLNLSTWVNQSDTEKLERVTDDFTIGFFNWATTYKANDKNNWQLSTKELLKTYKKEKGL